MPTRSVFSIIGLAHKFFLAAEKQGYTPELLNELAENPKLIGELIKVQRGYAEIKTNHHVINCDADPRPVPFRSGLCIEKHCKAGFLKWEPDKISIYLSEQQKNGENVEGNEFCKDIEKMPVLNANVLDYLLENTQLIPEEWKDKLVFFWGTIYQQSAGSLWPNQETADKFVRYLSWEEGKWCNKYYRIRFGFSNMHYAAVLKS